MNMEKREITKAILAAIGIAGILVVAATAPNAALLLKPFIERGRRQQFRKRSVAQAIRRLHKQRFIEFIEKGDKTLLQITERGEKRLREFNFEQLKLAPPQSRNRIWTIILFDIPEYKKTARDALRRKLKEIGCYQYHRSVFVYPAPCRDEIDFVGEFFEVAQYIIHFETPTLGNQERRALDFFDLR